MEREEAIDKLQDLWNEVYNEDSDGYDYAVAIDMAIEALSKPVVDITQRDLCKDISCEDCPFMQETCKLMDYVADAEAVQGEWTDIDDYYRMATCSRCHKVTMFEKWGEYTKPYDFCPNCGARMKGGEDE